MFPQATLITLPAMMAVTYEGKVHDIETEIAMDDDLLLRTMSTIYPELGTGKVVRNRRGGVETITLLKEAASKGLTGPVVDMLTEAPATRNPMMVLYEQIEGLEIVGLSPENRTFLSGKIQDALAAGEAVEKELGRIRERLTLSRPVAIRSIPIGF